MFSITDVIGVCKSVDEVTRLTTKTNKEVSKRTLNLMDMSGKVVTVTLWGEDVSIDITRRIKLVIMDVLCLFKWAVKINTSLIMLRHKRSSQDTYLFQMLIII